MSHMILAAVAAALVSFVCSTLIVLSQHWHGKHSMDHDLSGVQKFHTTPVPRVGGIAIFIGLSSALALLTFITPNKTAQVADIFKLLLASCPVFLAGTIEDLTKSVSVKIRAIASVASALLASWLVGATVHALNIWGVDSLLLIAPVAIAVTAFVVAGGTHAVNIIDGFHGIAASAVIIMSAAMGFLAWRCDDMLVTQLALLNMGAAFGFLLVNYPTGRLFIGDGGAYLSGFLVSEIAVLSLVRNPAINAWQILAICSYPVIEILYSIYRRKIIQKAGAGHPDRLHLHTLIYRRLLARSFIKNHPQPWVRNALVACLVGVWMTGASLAAVLFGNTIPGAMIIVLAQVALYMVTYARLVWWGRWRPQRPETVGRTSGKSDLP